MSELRLYCDLLMQQVHTIQEFVHHDENHSSPSVEVYRNDPVMFAYALWYTDEWDSSHTVAEKHFQNELFLALLG